MVKFTLNCQIVSDVQPESFYAVKENNLVQITCDNPLWFATFGGYLTSLEGVELDRKVIFENYDERKYHIMTNGVNRRNSVMQ